jgi:hypothetical protein
LVFLLPIEERLAPERSEAGAMNQQKFKKSGLSISFDRNEEQD